MKSRGAEGQRGGGAEGRRGRGAEGRRRSPPLLLVTASGATTLNCLQCLGCNWKCESGLPRDARKRRTNNESIWSAATCRRFPTDTQYHSGDKSPHSKRALIVQLHLTKADLRRLALLITPSCYPVSKSCNVVF